MVFKLENGRFYLLSQSLDKKWLSLKEYENEVAYKLREKICETRYKLVKLNPKDYCWKSVTEYRPKAQNNCRYIIKFNAGLYKRTPELCKIDKQKLETVHKLNKLIKIEKKYVWILEQYFIYRRI